VGSANDTFDYRVYVVKHSTGNLGGAVLDYEQLLFCSGTATLGTQAGVAASGPTSAALFADTLSVTASAYCTAVVAAYGGIAPSVYSPADNTQAKLFIPELGNAWAIFVDFDQTSGTPTMNCLIERGT